jgi:uncharacterized RDD family membrane protein YckC
MKAARVHELRVLTPDGVVFALPLAGPGVRALALSIDFLIIQAALITLSQILSVFAIVLPDLSTGVFLLIQFAVQVFYGMLLETIWGGRTIGKRIMGLRVADERGLHLKPSQVAVRNLLRPVDALPFAYLVGGLAAFFSQHAQRLGDLAAGTVVIRTRQVLSTDSDLENGKFNSFRAHPAMEARLRQRVEPEEAALLAQALARRDSLDPEARITLFAEMAEAFRSKVRFPDEATHGLTDEQYLRNTADSLFRPAKRKASNPV